MEEIIARLLAEMAKKICKTTFSSDWRGIGELTERLKVECLTTEKAILEECLRGINQAFRENKTERKEMELVLQEKDRHREILTSLGLIDVSRDCYFDKQNGTYVYPLERGACDGRCCQPTDSPKCHHQLRCGDRTADG